MFLTISGGQLAGFPPWFWGLVSVDVMMVLWGVAQDRTIGEEGLR